MLMSVLSRISTPPRVLPDASSISIWSKWRSWLSTTFRTFWVRVLMWTSRFWNVRPEQSLSSMPATYAGWVASAEPIVTPPAMLTPCRSMQSYVPAESRIVSPPWAEARAAFNALFVPTVICTLANPR